MLAYTRAEIHFHLSYTPHTPGQTAKQLVATPVDPGQLLRNPWLNFSRRILGEKSRLLLACRRIPGSCIPSGYTILFILDFISPIFVYSFINSFFSPRPAIVYFVSRIGIIWEKLEIRNDRNILFWGEKSERNRERNPNRDERGTRVERRIRNWENRNGKFSTEKKKIEGSMCAKQCRPRCHRKTITE